MAGSRKRKRLNVAKLTKKPAVTKEKEKAEEKQELPLDEHRIVHEEGNINCKPASKKYTC